MILNICSLSGEQFSFTIEKNNSVDSLKKKIVDYRNDNNTWIPNGYTLRYNDIRIVHDGIDISARGQNSSIDDCGIIDNDVLYIIDNTRVNRSCNTKKINKDNFKFPILEDESINSKISMILKEILYLREDIKDIKDTLHRNLAK